MPVASKSAQRRERQEALRARVLEVFEPGETLTQRDVADRLDDPQVGNDHSRLLKTLCMVVSIDKQLVEEWVDGPRRWTRVG